MTSRWGDFEHRFWNLLKSYDLEKAPSYLLAVSGGVDSMVLLEVMLRVRPQSEIRVAHFHHGLSDDSKQAKYRDQVAEFVKHKISTSQYFLGQTDLKLDTEAEMRKARWGFLRKVRQKNEPILTGHHLDDWFETALLKMMRGTSLKGISALQTWNGEIFRPFLKIPKREILEYANEQKVCYLDDPSNQSSDYLRNWVREKWLVDLEDRHQGSVANLSRSLLQIIEDFEKSETFELKLVENELHSGIDRTWFMTLSRSDQLKAIALFLKRHLVFEFTRGQLEEILKRLDKNQKDITFEIFERKWVINASQIMLQ